MEPILFSSIPLAPQHASIYRALGFLKGKTELPSDVEKKTNCHIAEAAEFIALKGCAVRLAIKKIDGESIIFNNNLFFKSKDLSKFLYGAREALLWGATAGTAIMEKISQKSAEGDLTRAVTYSATAGEMVDEALTWMTEYFKQPLLRERLSVDHRRFSAGYGDFSIEYQKDFYQILSLKVIGVTLTDEYFLVPEKSATAICGIRPAG